MDLDKTIPSPDHRTEDDVILKSGSSLGKYEIEKFLAEGGMGSVYLARHKDLQSLHAIKVVLKAFAADPKFVSRFRREARIMAALDHPNIVRVTDFGEEDGVPYYVMEYIDGPGGSPRTLEDELVEATTSGKQKGLKQRVVKEIMVQVCEALQYAHTFGNEGVAHLDLKPSNIMLTTTPTSRGKRTLVKITDFGLARLLDPQSALKSMAMSQMTHSSEPTKMIAGTPRYMSPEQWKGEATAGAASDIYSLGKILYEVLTGMVPQDLYQPPPPSASGCAPAWDLIVQKCLAHKPEGRYRDAAQLTAAIERVNFLQRTVQKKRKRRRSVAGPLFLAASLAVLGFAVAARMGYVDIDPYLEEIRNTTIYHKVAAQFAPLGSIAVRAEPGTPVAVRDVGGVEVTRAEVGSSGIIPRLELPAGDYVVVLGGDGDSTEHPVTVGKGESATVDAATQSDRPEFSRGGNQGPVELGPADVRVVSNVSGAEIYRNDVLLGRSGDVLSISSGIRHELEIRAPGFRTETLVLSLPEPDKRYDDYEVTMKERGASVRIAVNPPPGYGRRVRAEVLIDGASIGEKSLPLTWEVEDGGLHTVQVRGPAWKPVEAREVTLTKGTEQDISFDLELVESYFVFKVTPSDAVIYVDRNKISSSRIDVKAQAGHNVRIWAPKHEPHEEIYSVALGSTNTIEVVLKKKERDSRW